MSISKKLSLIILLTVLEVSFTIWAAIQISKGADFHQLNLLHLKYADQFEDGIDKMDGTGAVNISTLEKTIHSIREQPVACLEKASFLDKIIMKKIGTSYALDICERDIVVADTALGALSDFQDQKIDKKVLFNKLRKSLKEFHKYSADFEEPITRTVNFVFKVMIPLIILISLCNIIFIAYLSKSITESIQDAIRLLSDRSSNQQGITQIGKNVSGELLELLKVSEKRVQADLLNTGTSKVLKEMVSQKARELQTTLARHDLALKASKVGVWDWDMVTNTLIWDKQMYALQGVAEEDFEGAYEAWEKGLHPEDREECVAELERAITSNAKFDTEFRIIKPSGEIRNIRALGTLVKDDQGKPEKLVGVNWDITNVKNYQDNLKKANEKLSKANEELSQFAYRTSHDLKAPLISTKRLIKFVMDDMDKGNLDEAKANSLRISELMVSLSTMVADILALVKADVEVDERVGINIQQVVEDTKSKLFQLAEDNSCEIECNINIEGSPKAEKARLTQILENLISNGIKYREQSTEKNYVRANIQQLGADLLITVEDNGIGIPKDRQDEVYKPFKRLHADLSFGSGLGMAIVKKHVDYLGGEIKFTSSSEGTKFEVCLPGIFEESA